ncbi:MAG: transcriptional regulator [Paenibacillus sp.]|nr:transcriptional regulator [Paenibacillus sp.]
MTVNLNDFYNECMNIPIIATKLYMPGTRPKAVRRQRLIDRMQDSLQHRLTLLSAAAGYGKTTLLSSWLEGSELPAAWLSLDEGDNDLARFLAYSFAAMRRIEPAFGENATELFHAPPPPVELLLSAFLNELPAIATPFVLVLDDYHVIREEAIHRAIGTLIERMPSRMHLVIATRQDPPLPLARLRVRNDLAEVRAEQLQFSTLEAEQFLNRVMGLSLAQEAVDVLRARTEGWISGLQLAALSIQGNLPLKADSIDSFNGTNRFVLDYLLEEVLGRQPETIQTFLLHTSILERMCGPLCDALLKDRTDSLLNGQDTLEYLERANLFLIPLDNERRWYRYHHLFADLLRQRLRRVRNASSAADPAARLHERASIWYEENGLEIEAFHHAAAGQHVERAARLVEGDGMPLLFRGAITPVRNWLDALPREQLNRRPQLWVLYASSLLAMGQISEVEAKLRAAENALPDSDHDEQARRDIIGHIAATRSSLAVSQHQAETILTESTRALQHLRPDNWPIRSAASWSLGYACQLRGDRDAAAAAYADALSISERVGHKIIALLSTLGLGNMAEQQNRLRQAADTYQRALDMAGNARLPVICEAYIGLARIHCQWNNLDEGIQYAQQAMRLSEQIEHTDRAVAAKVVLAQLKLAYGEEGAASALLAEAEQTARQQRYMQQMFPIAEAQIRMRIRQGEWKEAMRLAQQHHLPLSVARVHLATGNSAKALSVMKPVRQQAEARGHLDIRLQTLVLQAIAEQNAQLLAEALAAAEQGGFIRIFVDEGDSLARLARECSARPGAKSAYFQQMLTAIQAEAALDGQVQPALPLIEPLSERELEILRLIAQGLSNQDIAERLFLALSTVKGHNRNLYGKLEVERRTDAVARARVLGLLRL